MKHVGIDLGATKTSLCVVSVGGQIERELTLRTDELGTWFGSQGPPPWRMVMESCAESRLIAQLAVHAGHEVCVVPAAVVRALGVGARRIKTDRKDAQVLAQSSYRLGQNLPSIYLRSDESAATMSLIRGRAELVSGRTANINFVRSHLRMNLLGRPRASSTTFTDVVRAVFGARGESPSPIIEAHLRMIDAFNGQIEVIDEQLEKLAQTELHRRLRKVPGVGPVIAVAMAAMIDDPKRFASGEHLASYLGLSPGEDTTGGNIRRLHIVASGQALLRSVLVQGAWSLMRAHRRNDPLALWARALAAKRGKRIAIVALARKLAIVLWAMMRDGTSYDPRLTQPRAPRETAVSSPSHTAEATP